MVTRLWPCSALKRRIVTKSCPVQLTASHILACYDNIVHVVPRAVADRLSPDSEPASGGHDRGDNGCSEAVKMQLLRGSVVLIKSKEALTFGYVAIRRGIQFFCRRSGDRLLADLQLDLGAAPAPYRHSRHAEPSVSTVKQTALGIETKECMSPRCWQASWRSYG